ncbi:uncharacterized protein BDZ99DRAFT_574499 [Mytilinidion resinicola]|uniref:Uncharacterized protein n=1 Tax=Mytilinidion resinicola TaxID=574789 RepID=A0A6A6YC46_9PEZI|nr:uncharacterized protein BDZ99DRAFT_574499 [Mytilinidion resinicola]KAF2805594.1 hypothetical protein BDZ99DRAFT_574499 [Mytilinidion resinicola]
MTSMDTFTHPLSGTQKTRVRQNTDFITARFPNPKTGRISPSNVSTLTTHHTPETLEEALKRSAIPNALSTNGSVRPHSERKGGWRSNSKDWWMEIKSSPATKGTQRSRKTSNATILTDGEGEEPAFESDAFAILMPTTREPIEPPAERPKCEFRAKLPSPSLAQVAAYQHYAEKTRRNASQEYKKEPVPNRIASWDYAYPDPHSAPEVVMEQRLTPPMSPPTDSPGTFPASPPLSPLVPPHHTRHPRSISTPAHSVARKPVAAESSSRQQDHTLPRDTLGGAEHSPPLSPSIAKDKVKIRVKAKAKTEPEKPQKVSWWSLYARSAPTITATTRSHTSSSSSGSSSSSAHTTSRTPSPTKNRVVAPPAVAYTLKETPGAWHTAPITTNATTDPATHPKPQTPRTRGLGFYLSWLKPAGPRPPTPTPTPAPYSSPFTTTQTPRLHKLNGVPAHLAATPAARAQNGFAQLQRAVLLLLKVCLVLYVAVGAWFVLDAVREAMWVVTWPVQAVGLVFGVLGRVLWEVGRLGAEGWRRLSAYGGRRF